MDVILKTWATENADPISRLVPYLHAIAMLYGGFYRVQIIDRSWDTVMHEVTTI